MKKYYFAVMVMLMALVSVGLTACGDDEPKVPSIVGTWQHDHEADNWDIYYQFTKDGKFHYVWKSHEVYYGRANFVVYHGTYTVSGKKLIVTMDPHSIFDLYDEPSVCEYSVLGDRLKLLGGDEPTFTRVEDSVIEPYLNAVPRPC